MILPVSPVLSPCFYSASTVTTGKPFAAPHRPYSNQMTRLFAVKPITDSWSDN